MLSVGGTCHPSLRRGRPQRGRMHQHKATDDEATHHDSARDPERALTSKQAGEILGVSIITLCQWRLRGEGPRWFSIGRRNIRYRLGDVLAWRDARVYARDPRKVKP